MSDDRILDAMVADPILVNRPIVVTPKGAKLCRPLGERPRMARPDDAGFR